MDLQKSNMTVLAQIVKLIPAKIIDSLAKKVQNPDRSLQSDQSAGRPGPPTGKVCCFLQK